MFNDKLNILMQSQNVSNVKLAKALSVDTSLVSRWRTGSRKPGKNSSFAREIAAYFLRRAKTEEHKRRLLDITGMNTELKTTGELSLDTVLEEWLLSGEEKSFDESSAIDSFLSGISSYRKIDVAPAPELIVPLPTGMVVTTEVLFGIKGKQNGVIRFLSSVIAQKEPRIILLFSNEDMEWLFSDRGFFLTWELLMRRVINNGNKIKIIHTVNRDITEMLSSIEAWMPLYFSGVIEPYYFLKYHKSVFRSTMFIARGVAALTAESIPEKADNTPYYYHTNAAIIDELANKFDYFLGLCRPLIHIITKNNFAGAFELYCKFEQQTGVSLYKASDFSPATLPEEVLNAMLRRMNRDEPFKNKLLHIFKVDADAFYRNVQSDSITEYIELPEIEDVRAGKVYAPFISLFDEAGIFYNVEEYALHLKNIVHLLEKYSNYNLFLCSNRLPNVSIKVKEEAGALIIKNNSPCVIFSLNLPDMTNAFFSKLEKEQYLLPEAERSKDYVIQTLNQYCHGLLRK
jgi:hypothetical protein